MSSWNNGKDHGNNRLNLPKSMIQCKHLLFSQHTSFIPVVFLSNPSSNPGESSWMAVHLWISSHLNLSIISLSQNLRSRTSSSLKDLNPNSCNAPSKSLRSQSVGGLLWDKVFLAWIVHAMSAKELGSQQLRISTTSQAHSHSLRR